MFSPLPPLRSSPDGDLAQTLQTAAMLDAWRSGKEQSESSRLLDCKCNRRTPPKNKKKEREKKTMVYTLSVELTKVIFCLLLAYPGIMDFPTSVIILSLKCNSLQSPRLTCGMAEANARVCRKIAAHTRPHPVLGRFRVNRHCGAKRLLSITRRIIFSVN